MKILMPSLTFDFHDFWCSKENQLTKCFTNPFEDLPTLSSLFSSFFPVVPTEIFCKKVNP